MLKYCIKYEPSFLFLKKTSNKDVMFGQEDPNN
jgi:hypothetical protein